MSDFLPKGLPAGPRRRIAGPDARLYVRAAGSRGIVRNLRQVAGVGR